MSDYPLVTVVTLAYNNGGLVLPTLCSIKSQTYSNIDHIIFDDASTDDTAALIERWIEENNYPCRFFKNGKNIGICKSLNKALGHASGEYFSACSDDYWEPFHLEKSLELLEKSEADVLFTSTRICKRDGTQLYMLEDMLQLMNYPRLQQLLPPDQPYMILDKKNAVDALFYLNYLHLITGVIPMRWLKENGGFDESLPFEDYDLAFRICSQLKVCFNRTFTATYYKHERSYTVDPARAVSLNLGTIRTLSKYSSLIAREDTRHRYEKTVTESCTKMLSLCPRMFFRVIAEYKASLPWRSWKESIIYFLKKLYLMRRELFSTAKH